MALNRQLPTWHEGKSVVAPRRRRPRQPSNVQSAICTRAHAMYLKYGSPTLNLLRIHQHYAASTQPPAEPGIQSAGSNGACQAAHSQRGHASLDMVERQIYDFRWTYDGTKLIRWGSLAFPDIHACKHRSLLPLPSTFTTTKFW